MSTSTSHTQVASLNMSKRLWTKMKFEFLAKLGLKIPLKNKEGLRTRQGFGELKRPPPCFKQLSHFENEIVCEKRAYLPSTSLL